MAVSINTVTAGRLAHRSPVYANGKIFRPKGLQKNGQKVLKSRWKKRIIRRSRGRSLVTVAGKLMRYAHRFTASKISYQSELNRISRYLDAAGMPLLQPRVNDHGNMKFVKVLSGLPPPFIDDRTARRDKREKINALRARSACTLASSVSKAVTT